MTKNEPIIIKTREVACDGGDQVLGHPKVYLEIDPKTNELTCPYCGRHFIYQQHATDSNQNNASNLLNTDTF